MTKDGKDQKGVADLPFTPWGEAEWKKYDAADGDYTGACLPFGMTRSINTPEPMQIMQSDKYFVVPVRAELVVHGRSDRRPPASRRHRHLVRRLGRSLGRRHARHRHRQLQRQDPAGYGRPSAQRSAAPDAALLAARPRPHLLRSDRRRSQDVHQAVEERADLHAAARLGNDGVLLRGEQQEPLGGPDQGSKTLSASIPCSQSRPASESCVSRSPAWAGGPSGPFRSFPLRRRTDRPSDSRTAWSTTLIRPMRADSTASGRMYQWLDRAPRGRNKTGVWWRRHDEY